MLAMEPVTQSGLINRAIGLKQGDGYIDVIKLAKSYGIDIFLEKETGEGDFNACIKRNTDTNTYEIWVHPEQPLERQRFSIAHELAHFVLHKGKLDAKGQLNRDPDDAVNKSEEEKADLLAEKILMPEKFVEEYITKKHIDTAKPFTKETIDNVSNHFKVSRIVAAIRLRHLSYFVPYISFA